LGPDIGDLASELLGDQTRPPCMHISHPQFKYVMDKPVSEGYRQLRTRNLPSTETALRGLKEGRTRLPRITWAPS
jgi:hypothetical protein